MIEGNRSKTSARASVTRSSVSRRDVLRIGGAIIPAGILLPAWMSARAQQAPPSTFDYYISPSGSDSNPGTLAAPWAITSASNLSFTSQNVANNAAMAGKRVGFLPGTYDVSAMMPSTIGGALFPPAGSASANTYWASSDSNGNYSLRTATLNAKGSNGLYGGHAGGPGNEPAIIGHLPESGPQGYIVIDGLVFTGFSYRAIRIGGVSYGGPELITNPVVIQNCELTGGGHNSGDGLDNAAAIWIDGTRACTIHNCYIHDNAPWTAGDQGHTNAIIAWQCSGSIIQYNTVVNSGNVYGKVEGNQGNIIQYNYIDASMYTSEAGGIGDWTGAPSSNLTMTTIFRNNIILMASGVAIGWPTLSNSYGFSTPLLVYNNTIVSQGSGPVVAWVTDSDAGTVQFYNNIYTGGSGGSFNNWGNFMVNPSAPGIWDYNLVPTSGVTWTLYSNSNFGSSIASYSSASAFASGLASNGGISNAEAHSISGTPTFTNSGTLAQLYQLAAGSPGKGAGSTSGTPSGQPTDMGAWGNGATQIGANLSGSAVAQPAVPMAPVLTVS